MLTVKVDVYSLDGGKPIASWTEAIRVITLEAAQHFVAVDYTDCSIVLSNQRLGSLMQVRRSYDRRDIGSGRGYATAE